MSIAYTYQTNEVLTRIAPDLIQTATQDDPIFKIFPIRPRNASRLRWMVKDNYKGLMQLRGIGGEPTRITRVGDTIFEDQPGAYGQYSTIDELEMTNRAANYPAGVNVPIDVRDLVSEAQEQLTYLQVARMKQICWTLAISATFTVALPTGGIGHTGSYTAQTTTVSPLWSTVATATPLKDLRGLQLTYGFGTSNMFNGMAEAWMNSATANYALNNTNASDLGGKRVEGGSTVNDLPSLNRILAGTNVPSFNIWDDGYIDSSGTFQLFIPTGKILIVGKRPDGDTPGEFQMTRNAVNNGTPAPYSFVDDRTQEPKKTVPPRIDIHQGFNGGPVVERATQLVVVTVA